MMHEFCSHCDVRKTSLFEINQQFADQMENLRAENKNLKSLLKYYESADVAEVVRCKDCVFWQDNNGGYPHQECRWGRGETPDPDDYCSFGESVSEDYDMKIYDPKARHINADLADRCNHGTRE